MTDLASAAGGMKVDVTRTTSTDFSVTLTPLANPSAAFTTTGTFANPSFPIDWFQFETFNGIESDAGSPVNGDFNGNGKVDAADYVWLRQNGNPPEDFALWRSAFGNSGGAPTTATDFYIRSMSITAATGSGSGAVPEPGTIFYVMASAGAAVSAVRRRR